MATLVKGKGNKGKNKPQATIEAQAPFVDDGLDSVFPIGPQEKPRDEPVAEAEGDSVPTVRLQPQMSDAALMAERMAQASKALTTFDLTIGCRNLLTRAVDNVIGNDTRFIKNEKAKAKADAQIALLTATDGDLGLAMECLAEAHEPKDVPGEIYSLLFTVLKAATFLANFDYRRALDPNSEFDYGLYCPAITCGEDGADKYDDDFRQFLVDKREDASPLDGNTGHATTQELQLQQMQDLYGRDFQCMEDAVLSSLRDLQLFFQLTAESMGWWDNVNPMPYMVMVDNPDAVKPKFTSICSAIEALDIQEVKRLTARAKANDKLAKTQTIAVALAASKLKAMLAKTKS